MHKISAVLALLLIPTLVFAQPAWINTRDDVFVRGDERGPSIALLRYGDQVQVQRSVEGWSYLIPRGRVPTRLLSTGPRPEEGSFLNDPRQFQWGRVRRDFRVGSESFTRSDEIIIRPGRDGYYRRPNGQEFPQSMVTRLTPSTFSGWHNPTDLFAFVVRSDRYLTRYERYALRSVDRTEAVTTAGLVLPRINVRVGGKHQRPATVPNNAQWVHVDLSQQVLTAYEGDRMIFATLVSTGKGRTPTHQGLFQVRRKIVQTRMRGGGRRPYDVEGVPWTMYLGDDDGPSAQALHGNYWHDRLGQVMSHGCINLSLSDAEYLYNWARPAVPVGWRSIHPVPFSGDGLWVHVEE